MDKAKEILREIQGILKREGYVLAHQAAGMVLGAVPRDLTQQVKVVAVVRLITPDIFEWSPIEWMKPEAVKFQTEKIQ